MKRNKWIDGVNHSLDRHATKRLRQRNINIHHVWETLEYPDEYEDLDNDAARVSKWYGKKKLQAVLYPVPGTEFILVTTVYYDEEYTEDKWGSDKAKLIARKEKHNKDVYLNHKRKGKRKSFKGIYARKGN